MFREVMKGTGVGICEGDTGLVLRMCPGKAGIPDSGLNHCNDADHLYPQALSEGCELFPAGRCYADAVFRDLEHDRCRLCLISSILGDILGLLHSIEMDRCTIL